MTGTTYEMTYAIAQQAQQATSEVEKIVAKLIEMGRAVTCRELGLAVYGDEYNHVPENERNSWRRNLKARELTGRVNQALQHMIKIGKVEKDFIWSEPYTYEVEDLVTVVNDEVIEEFIEVWDAKGKKYELRNPEWKSGRREWRKVTKTGRKKINTYQWIG